MQQTNKNTLARHPNRQTLCRIVKGFVGRNARIEVFGSSVCGFDTVHSDVDLTISIGGMPMASADQSDLLKRLSKALRFQHGMQVWHLPAVVQVSIHSHAFLKGTYPSVCSAAW
jgi:predicted nucleotidyltransferase